MDKMIGFIGCGNMAQAMINGILKAQLVPAENILASPLKKEMEERFGIRTTASNIEVASEADYLILAVKPHIYKLVIEEVRDYIKKDAIVISIGAGISSRFLEENLNEGTKYVKTMPNTPAMVGEGMTAVCPPARLTEEELDGVLRILNTFGKTEILDESLMDGATALSGSSPAYVFMFIEAMADAAVLEGIPRKQAYTMAAQAVLGSAKMVLETGIHPGQLKDNVCSPGGTTIEAVTSLERSSFRSAVIEAMRACAQKSRDMSR